MSLDVSLTIDTYSKKEKTSGIFVRENGATVEITEEEYYKRFPDNGEPCKVAHDSGELTDEVFTANITHNLCGMADAAGIYKHLWRPEEIGITKAGQLIEALEKALADMKARPDYYEQFNAKNGWGKYIDFVPWIENYLNACKEYPEATIQVSR